MSNSKKNTAVNNEANNEATELLKHEEKSRGVRSWGTCISRWIFNPAFAVKDIRSYDDNPRGTSFNVLDMVGTGAIRRPLVVYLLDGVYVALQGNRRLRYAIESGQATVPAFVIEFLLSPELITEIVNDHNGEVSLTERIQAYKACEVCFKAGRGLVDTERTCQRVLQGVHGSKQKDIQQAEIDYRRDHKITPDEQLEAEDIKKLEEIQLEIIHKALYGHVQLYQAVYRLPEDLKALQFEAWATGRDFIKQGDLKKISGKFSEIEDKVTSALMTETDDLEVMESNLVDEIGRCKSDDKKGKLTHALDYVRQLKDEGKTKIEPISSTNYPVSLREELDNLLSKVSTGTTKGTGTKRRADTDATNAFAAIAAAAKTYPMGSKQRAYLAGVLDGIRYMNCNVESIAILERAVNSEETTAEVAPVSNDAPVA